MVSIKSKRKFSNLLTVQKVTTHTIYEMIVLCIFGWLDGDETFLNILFLVGTVFSFFLHAHPCQKHNHQVRRIPLLETGTPVDNSEIACTSAPCKIANLQRYSHMVPTKDAGDASLTQATLRARVRLHSLEYTLFTSRSKMFSRTKSVEKALVMCVVTIKLV